MSSVTSGPAFSGGNGDGEVGKDRPEEPHKSKATETATAVDKAEGVGDRGGGQRLSWPGRIEGHAADHSVAYREIKSLSCVPGTNSGVVS